MAYDALNAATWNSIGAAHLIDSCVAQGIDHFFLAPGSRCTPLTLAIARRSDCQIMQHVDERGLAFAALGFARGRQRAAAVVCSSGTAVANCLPAVVEAAYDHVPLLIITAARPPELHEQSANQAIDQDKIFGTFTRWFWEVPCPAPELTAAFYRSGVRYAVEQLTSGPVHFNCLFREPFGGDDSFPPIPPSHGDASETTAPQIGISDWTIPPGTTLVAIGQATRSETRAAVELANRLGAPWFADITSSYRGEIRAWQLADESLPRPEIILHVGGRIVSKRWWQFVEKSSPPRYIHLTNHGRRFDPALCITDTYRGPIEALCSAAVIGRSVDAEFTKAWQACGHVLQQMTRAWFDAQPTLTEPKIAHVVAERLPKKGGLFLGNSMPIRDMDQFGEWRPEQQITVAANRGASGIDGQLATAVGFARGLDQPTMAVLGDLSSLHDLNSFHLVARSKPPIGLVVINNDGGGIFHFLPIATRSRHFEQLFATPHGYHFEHAAQMFGIEYHQIESCAQLQQACDNFWSSPRPVLLEVATDRQANYETHRAFEAFTKGRSEHG